MPGPNQALQVQNNNQGPDSNLSLREKKKQERQISQNTIEEKNENTKTNKLYLQLNARLKQDKNGHTLMTQEEGKEAEEENFEDRTEKLID